MNINKKSLISTAIACAFISLSGISQPVLANNAGASLNVEKQQTGLVTVTDQFVSGETFTTDENSWLELVFKDGTSILLTPGSKIVVNEYNFSSDSVQNRMHITILSGSARVLTSNDFTNAVDITVGDTTAKLKNGALLVQIDPATQGAEMTLLWGERADISNAQGKTSLRRGGYSVVLANGVLSSPAKVSPEQLGQRVALLAPTKGSVVSTWTGEFSSEGDEDNQASDEDSESSDSEASEANQNTGSSNDSSNPGPGQGSGQLGLGGGFNNGSKNSDSAAGGSGSKNGQDFFNPLTGVQITPVGTTDAIDPSPAAEGTFFNNFSYSLRIKRSSGDNTSNVATNINDNGAIQIRDSLPVTSGQTIFNSVGNFYDGTITSFLFGTNSDENVSLILTEGQPTFGNVPNTRGSEVIYTGFELISFPDTIPNDSNVTTVTASDLTSDGVETINPGNSIGSISLNGGDTLGGSYYFITRFSGSTSIDGAFAIYDLDLTSTNSNNGDRYLIFGGERSEQLPSQGAGKTIATYGLTNSLDRLSTGQTPGQSLNTLSSDSFRPTTTVDSSILLDGITRGDTKLLVVNDSSASSTGGFLRSELQLDANNNNGRSTIAVTVGRVGQLGGAGSPVGLDGHMVASSRGDTGNTSTAIQSAIGSVGTTGSNGSDDAHLFGGNFTAPGNASNFDDFAVNLVLSQDDPTTSGAEAAEVRRLPPVTPLDPGYAFTRYAALTGTAAQTGSASNLTGFAAGQVESISTSASIYAVSSNSLTVSNNVTNNTVSASLPLTASAIGGGTAPAGSTLNFGGDTETSTSIDSNRFAAVGNTSSGVNPNIAITSSAGITNGIVGTNTDDYTHAQWGFWFGDILVNGTTDHVLLGTWVAGNVLDLDAQKATGPTSADYAGHVIGNVFNQPANGTTGSLRDVAGTFDATYDFQAGSGAINNFNFDGTNYSGTAISQTGATNNFSGNKEFSGGVIPADQVRNFNATGAFFGTSGTASDIGGQFSIQQTGGTDIYQANGVFVGGQ